MTLALINPGNPQMNGSPCRGETLPGESRTCWRAKIKWAFEILPQLDPACTLLARSIWRPFREDGSQG
jgi:hypothetical protein